MNLSRRDLLKRSAGAAAVAAASAVSPATSVAGSPAAAAPASSPSSPPTSQASSPGGDSIDVRGLLARYSPVVRQIDPYAALSVGNGEFAFTADVTGLQTFPEKYVSSFPLCTAAQWAWHTEPMPAGMDAANFRYRMWNTHGRPVPYATDPTGQEELFEWLRQNPRRFHLGQIGLVLPTPEITNIEQTLDLWSGMLTSKFECAGQPVRVETCAHPTRDALAVRVTSPLLSDGRLRVKIGFPYGSPQRPMGNWDVPPERHSSRLTRPAGGGNENRATIERKLDADAYHVALHWSAGSKIDETAPHHFELRGSGEQIEFTVGFSQQPPKEPLPAAEQVRTDSARHWETFWTTGGIIDLSGSTHPQASELQRRIILSQYNLAVHCAGSLPPQETGLLFNSWNGKHHLEMHWWHAVHFTQWNHFDLFARGIGYYENILPAARELAKQQGYAGARWPKMTDPAGRDSPSKVGPLLIWQQPHPIYYAELCYQHDPSSQTLQRWRTIVEESAEFMADFAHLEGNGTSARYVLGPPIKTVSENNPTDTTTNPTFELSYWRWGLSTAQKWRERAGQPRNAKWDEVLAKLAPLPVEDGVYLMQEGMTDTYTTYAWEHPALLMPAALGVGEWDEQTMRRTLRRVMETWDWNRVWGWDFGVLGMAAARLNEPQIAVDALLIDSPKNLYHPNGHVYQRENLTSYLPANGALLNAVAMLATTSGFPKDGRWTVRWKNLKPLTI